MRTDSFQITNWMYGQRNRSRSTFFHASEAVMWRAVVEGRDCIVVSGPTYRVSKVEFAFSTEGQNAQAWDALAASGVRAADALPPPPGMPDRSGLVPPPEPVRPPGEPALPSGFKRIGNDLGNRQRTGVGSPAPNGGPAPGPGTSDAAGSGFGRSGRKPPIPARDPRMVAIAVVAAAVLVLPVLLTFMMWLSTDGISTSLRTSQCVDDAASGHVVWSGTITTNRAIPAGSGKRLFVAVDPTPGALVNFQTALTASVSAGTPTALGPFDIPVPGNPALVSCTASIL